MKKAYTKALCIRNDFGYERVLIVGKTYEIISRTNRYVTIQTELGIQGVWKGYFKLSM
jgi:hypothetical protein